MKRTILHAPCALFIVLLTACNSPESKSDPAVMVKSSTVDMGQVRSEIQALENEWAALMVKKDAAALIELYSDDAQSLRPNAPTLKGKAAIKAFFDSAMAISTVQTFNTFQTQDVYGTPDEVTEVGTVTEKDASGKIISTGKYISVFRKVDGKYKCVREIYNADTK